MPLVKKIKKANTNEKAKVIYLYWNCLALWLELIIDESGLRNDNRVTILPMIY